MSNLPQLRNNQLYQDSSLFFFFEKVNSGQLKICKYQLLKMARSRCCQFNKTIKGPGTSFQFPVSSIEPKTWKKIFFIQHTNIWPNFILIVLRIKKNKHKCNFYYIAMPMMMSQIFNSMDFTGFQKNSRTKHIKGCFMAKIVFVEVTFNQREFESFNIKLSRANKCSM